MCGIPLLYTAAQSKMDNAAYCQLYFLYVLEMGAYYPYILFNAVQLYTGALYRQAQGKGQEISYTEYGY